MLCINTTRADRRPKIYDHRVIGNFFVECPRAQSSYCVPPDYASSSGLSSPSRRPATSPGHTPTPPSFGRTSSRPHPQADLVPRWATAGRHASSPSSANVTARDRAVQQRGSTRTTRHAIRTRLGAPWSAAISTPAVPSCSVGTAAPKNKNSADTRGCQLKIAHPEGEEKREPAQHVFRHLLFAVRVDAEPDIPIQNLFISVRFNMW